MNSHQFHQAWDEEIASGRCIMQAGGGEAAVDWQFRRHSENFAMIAKF